MPSRSHSGPRRRGASATGASLKGVTRGLIIQEPWISEILAGRKPWELRTKTTKIRGPVALIRSGSGLIIGVANLTDSLPKLSRAQMERTTHKHRVPKAQISAAYKARWRTPWMFDSVKTFARPRRYQHPSGAVTWVTLKKAA